MSKLDDILTELAGNFSSGMGISEGAVAKEKREIKDLFIAIVEDCVVSTADTKDFIDKVETL